MKYPKENWNELSDAQKMFGIKKELDLETHNATTKDDLLMMLEWLYNYRTKTN